MKKLTRVADLTRNAAGFLKELPWPARLFSDQLKLEKVVPDGEEGAMRKSRFTEEQMVGILR